MVTAEKPLNIKEDDKFFSRLMSKETSMANSSCRVYYGEAGAVPFTWESQPGTPKHPFSHSSIPPLTPPPSYSSSSNSTSKSKSMLKISKPKLFTAPTTTTTTSAVFFSALLLRKKTAHVKSSSLSSSSSSSSSLWSPSNTSRQRRGRRRCFSGSGIQLDCGYDEDEHEPESPTSTLCFSVSSKQTAWISKSSDGVSGRCYSMGNLKNALLSIVFGHGSGQGTASS